MFVGKDKMKDAVTKIINSYGAVDSNLAEDIRDLVKDYLDDEGDRYGILYEKVETDYATIRGESANFTEMLAGIVSDQECFKILLTEIKKTTYEGLIEEIYG